MRTPMRKGGDISAVQLAARKAWCEKVLGQTAEGSGERRAMVEEMARELRLCPQHCYQVVERYDAEGRDGLLRKERRDRGRRRSISPKDVDAFIGWAKMPDHLPWPKSMVIREYRIHLRQIAGRELECSDDVLRKILDEVHRGLDLTREEREDAFLTRLLLGSKYPNHFWELDARRGDLWVVEEATGELIRPWLLHFVDHFSGYDMGGGYFARYNMETLEAALLDALFPDPAAGIPCCGIPEAIYLDNGKPHVSDWFGRVCGALGIRLFFSLPHKPRSHGFIEQTHNTAAQFEMKQPRYTGSDNDDEGRPAMYRLVEQGEIPADDPRWRPLLLSELNQRWRAHVAGELANREYKRTTRLARFMTHVPPERFQVPDQVWLATQLEHRTERMVRGGQIQWNHLIYTSPHLGELNGETVTFCYHPRWLRQAWVRFNGTCLPVGLLEPSVLGEEAGLRQLRDRNKAGQQILNRIAESERLVQAAVAEGSLDPEQAEQAAAAMREVAKLPVQRRASLRKSLDQMGRRRRDGAEVGKVIPLPREPEVMEPPAEPKLDVDAYLPEPAPALYAVSGGPADGPAVSDDPYI